MSDSEIDCDYDEFDLGRLQSPSPAVGAAVGDTPAAEISPTDPGSGPGGKAAMRRRHKGTRSCGRNESYV